MMQATLITCQGCGRRVWATGERPRRCWPCKVGRAVLAALLLAVLTACGPVAPTTQPTAAEVLARRALAAALQVALVEACRATIPTADAHPAHRLAWALACSHVPMPAVGVPTLPPPPPALPPEVP